MKNKCKRIHLNDFLKFIFFYSYMLIFVAILSHLITMVVDLIIMWKKALYGDTTEGTVFPYTGSINKEQKGIKIK